MARPWCPADSGRLGTSDNPSGNEALCYSSLGRASWPVQPLHDEAARSREALAHGVMKDVANGSRSIRRTQGCGAVLATREPKANLARCRVDVTNALDEVIKVPRIANDVAVLVNEGVVEIALGISHLAMELAGMPTTRATRDLRATNSEWLGCLTAGQYTEPLECLSSLGLLARIASLREELLDVVANKFIISGAAALARGSGEPVQVRTRTSCSRGSTALGSLVLHRRTRRWTTCSTTTLGPVILQDGRLDDAADVPLGSASLSYIACTLSVGLTDGGGWSSRLPLTGLGAARTISGSVSHQ